MLLARGNDNESLMDFISRLNETLSIDSVLTNSSKITLDCAYDNGKIRWNLMKTPEGRNVSLKSILQRMENEEISADTDSIKVLSFRGTEPEKTWDGKVVSNWLAVEPYNSVPVDSDGAIRYEQQTLLLEDIEDVETGIALSINGSIYMVSNSALNSIARYMRSGTGLGKRTDDDTLGVCIQIAQAFENNVNLNFLVRREENSTYSNLIGIVGNYYHLFDMREFYKTIFDFMSQRGLWEVKTFRATTISTDARFEWISMEEYALGLAVSTPQIKNSYSVCPYIRYNDMFLYVAEYKVSHKRDYAKQAEALEKGLKLSMFVIEDIVKALSMDFNYVCGEEIIKNLQSYRNRKAYSKLSLSKAKPVTNGSFFSFMESIISAQDEETAEVTSLTFKRLAAGEAAKQLYNMVKKPA